MLTFGKDNAKLKGIITFSLPAGYSCPMAKFCLSKADRETGKLTDGRHTAFRCFSASAEAMYPAVRDSRWSNYEQLKGKTKYQMVDVLQEGLNAVRFPKGKAKIVRIHVSGDFFSMAYFEAWIQIAENNPDVLFYAYTKSVGYWVALKDSIPANLKLTASKGGTQDPLIAQHGLKYAEVVYTEQEAADKGMVIDHDDSNAYGQDKSFALLLHGGQPKGSAAAKALSALKAQGITGYSK